MNGAPRSWIASIVGLALAVLAISAALNWAAELLREALPVLLPTAGAVLLCLLAWRYFRRRDGW